LLSLANSDRPTKHLLGESSNYYCSQIHFTQDLQEHLVCFFNLLIALRVVRRGASMFDSIMLQYLSHIFIYKWSVIVANELVRYAKASDDMLSYKVCQSSTSSLSEWDCLHPLSKILDGYKNPNMAAGSRTNRTN
jgi:hypothetical protein